MFLTTCQPVQLCKLHWNQLAQAARKEIWFKTERLYFYKFFKNFIFLIYIYKEMDLNFIYIYVCGFKKNTFKTCITMRIHLLQCKN